MIFVTVGTHEQQFNRVVECIDNMKRDGIIKDEVIIQTGFCTYEPKYCKWSKFITYNEMVSNIKNARIVITHGGPSSFIMPLQIGKIPIVIPRQLKFSEHINDHQVDFVQNISDRMGNIIPIIDIEDLCDKIKNYNAIVEMMNNDMSSNNSKFNKCLEEIVKTLF